VTDDVDFAAEGLLDGLTGRAREERLELLKLLYADGVPLDELRRAVADGRLLLLPAERLVGGESVYTFDELVDRSGVDPDFFRAVRRALGLPGFGPDDRTFREDDVAAARLAVEFEKAGVPREAMLATTRVLGRGLAQAADVMRSILLGMVMRPGATEAELALGYAQASDALAPMMAPLLEQLLRIHLRDAVRSELVSVAERDEGALPGARPVAACFADLVGFTRLGESVPPDELGRVAERLEELAADVVASPVRLVKTIGDAVMLVSPETAALVDAALDLVDAAEAEPEEFPQVRAGIAYGPALNRAGDWFGRPVNLASRVTGIARPGSVLVTEEVKESAPDGYRWSFAGARTLKNVPEPQRLYRVRRPQEDDEEEAPAPSHRATRRRRR
jgi:adenylate cyclase